MQPAKPTPDELRAAAGRRVEDVIAPGLEILFSGINPGLYSAAVGHHFARPGNRFWKVLALSGLTPELLGPADERRLLELGLGITNLVARASATAAELTTKELREGAAHLRSVVEATRPRTLAVLGVTAYRVAFSSPRARIGLQPDPIGSSRVVVLPNPSGAQARYQLPELSELFADLLGRGRSPAEPAAGAGRS